MAHRQQRVVPIVDRNEEQCSGQHCIDFQSYKLPLEKFRSSESSGAIYTNRHWAEPRAERLSQ